MSTEALWWIALGAGAVVAVVAIVLLQWFLNEVHRIEAGSKAIWEAGKQVAANTATTWMLGETSERLDLLTEEALRHDALLRTGSSAPKGVLGMRGLLLTLTVVEILAFVIVLVVYLVSIARSLRRTSGYLGKVTFGVRAIETQCAPIGSSVTRINTQLTTIAGALAGLARLAGDGQRRG